MSDFRDINGAWIRTTEQRFRALAEGWISAPQFLALARVHVFAERRIRGAYMDCPGLGRQVCIAPPKIEYGIVYDIRHDSTKEMFPGLKFRKELRTRRIE